MAAASRSVFTEGVIAGVIGAAVLLAWYAIFDVRAGHPMQTVSALGTFLSHGYFSAAASGPVTQTSIGSLAVYLIFAILVGLGLAKLAQLAASHLSLRMGIWLGGVIAFGIYLTLTIIAVGGSGQPVPLAQIALGNGIAAAAMVAFLMWRHRSITDTRQPLGAEGRAPPAPPERGSSA